MPQRSTKAHKSNQPGGSADALLIADAISDLARAVNVMAGAIEKSGERIADSQYMGLGEIACSIGEAFGREHRLLDVEEDFGPDPKPHLDRIRERLRTRGINDADIERELAAIIGAVADETAKAPSAREPWEA